VCKGCLLMGSASFVYSLAQCLHSGNHTNTCLRAILRSRAPASAPSPKLHSPPLTCSYRPQPPPPSPLPHLHALPWHKQARGVAHKGVRQGWQPRPPLHPPQQPHQHSLGGHPRHIRRQAGPRGDIGDGGGQGGGGCYHGLLASDLGREGGGEVEGGRAGWGWEGGVG
jgi:hypothetical protein